MLIGFRPDEIVVKIDEGEIKRNDIIIGIYSKTISKNGGYAGLIGLEILDERSEIRV